MPTKVTRASDVEEDEFLRAGLRRMVGAPASADQILGSAQASLSVARGPWMLVSSMMAAAASSTAATPCGSSIDAGYASFLKAASDSACRAASLAVQAAQLYAQRCTAAASAAADARPCPGLDLSNEQAQQTAWGTIWNGEANCIDPNLYRQVAAQMQQAQTSVAAALAAKNAACPTTRPIVRVTLPGRRFMGFVGSGSDFSSLDPSVQAAFNSGPGQQLQAEGVDPGTIDGQKQVFASQYTALLPLLSQGATSDSIASAAAQYVGLGSTQAGAQQIVSGLISAAESGDASQIINAFSGVAIAEVGTAVAAGAVSAGVGAAIVAGISLVSAGLSDLFNTPPPVANVGPCGLNYKPSFTIPGASVACKQGTPTTAGPSNAAWSLWRKFPNPSRDPWWFQVASVPQGQLSAIETTWNHGSWSDEWVACVENGLRPIDQACYENGVPVYARIDVDNQLLWLGAVAAGNPEAVAVLPQLQKAWFAAWKANREYDFNGLQRQADWQVLQQVVARWNLSRSPGQGIALSPVPLPPGAFLPSDPPDPLSCYMQMVIQDLRSHTNSISGAGVYDPTTGRGVLDANGNVHINTGLPKNLPVHLPPIHLHPPSSSSTTSHGARNVAIGAGVLALGGLGTAALVAYRRKTTTKRVLEGAWRGAKNGTVRVYRRIRRAF